jgi:phosphoserine aminotransferase
MLILSPRAVDRLETFTPPWPLPKLFRLTHGGKLIEAIFAGETINTPSLMCVEDYIDALNWGKSLGGLDALIARADANSKALGDWVERTAWVDFLASDPKIRSNTSVCLKIVDPAIATLPQMGQAAFAKSLENLLDMEKVAYDIGAYRDAPPGLRIWCGATIETSDIKALTPWLDAFAKLRPISPWLRFARIDRGGKVSFGERPPGGAALGQGRPPRQYFENSLGSARTDIGRLSAAAVAIFKERASS